MKIINEKDLVSPPNLVPALNEKGLFASREANISKNSFDKATIERASQREQELYALRKPACGI